MPQPQDALKDFKPEKKFFIGIDSDGIGRRYLGDAIRVGLVSTPRFVN